MHIEHESHPNIPNGIYHCGFVVSQGSMLMKTLRSNSWGKNLVTVDVKNSSQVFSAPYLPAAINLNQENFMMTLL